LLNRVDKCLKNNKFIFKIGMGFVDFGSDLDRLLISGSDLDSVTLLIYNLRPMVVNRKDRQKVEVKIRRKNSKS